jgi:ADP-ribosylation factor-binding protein GGA
VGPPQDIQPGPPGVKAQPSTDPFANISTSSTPQQKTPFAPPQSKPANTKSAFDFGTPAALEPAASAQNANGSSADDDWEFSSAVPDELPLKDTITVSDGKEVDIVFEISRADDEPDPNTVNILAKFSNKTPKPITEYTFQVAVTKVRGNRALSRVWARTHPPCTGIHSQAYPPIRAEVATPPEGRHHPAD